MYKKRLCVLILFFLISFIIEKDKALSVIEGGKNMGIKITSSAFKDGEMIPGKYTCDGKDMSPPISWDSVPNGTKEHRHYF